MIFALGALIAIFIYCIYTLTKKHPVSDDESLDAYNELVRVVSSKDYNADIMHNTSALTIALSTDNDYSFLYNANYIGMYDHEYTDIIVDNLVNLASDQTNIIDRVYALMFSVLSHNFKYVLTNKNMVLDLIDAVSDGHSDGYYDRLSETYTSYMTSK